MPKFKMPLDVNGKISTDDQLESTIATGTPPLAINSVTKVPNLNAEMVDDIHFRNNPELQWSLDEITWYDIADLNYLSDLEDVTLNSALPYQALIKSAGDWINANPIYVSETEPPTQFDGMLWIDPTDDSPTGEIGYTGSRGSLGYTGSVGGIGDRGYTGSRGQSSATPLFSGAKVISTNPQNGLTNDTFVKIDMDTTQYDTSSWWDNINKKFVVPAGVDYINLIGYAKLEDDSGNQSIQSISIYKDGSLYREVRNGYNSNLIESWYNIISEDIAVEQGDSFELYAYSYNTGSSTWKIVDGFFSIRTLGSTNAASVTNQRTGEPVKVWVGTEAQYQALGSIDPATLYFRS